MKAHKNGYYTFREARREVVKQARDDYTATFHKVADELLAQSTATFLWTMAHCYGWRGKRLRQLVDFLHDTRDLMFNPSPLHHRFDPLDCEKELLEHYGIDVRKEFKAEVVEQR